MIKKLLVILAIVILILLVWFGVKIGAGIKSFFDFLIKWWWSLAIVFILIYFHRQAGAILNTILGKLGVKV